MSEKLKQEAILENGDHQVMTGLDFIRALNANADELGTETKLDLDTHNTPEFVVKALREQSEAKEKSQKISNITPGGPDDVPTFEEEGAPVNSPSKMLDGVVQIYNKAIEGEEPEKPEITNVELSFESDLKEGEANVQTGAEIGTFSTTGGEAPYTYSLTEENENLEISEDKLKAKKDLKEQNTTVKFQVEDKNGKTKTGEAQLVVEAATPADPEITSVTVNATPDLAEGEENVKTNAQVATISVEGGTQPYTYTPAEGGTDNDSFNITSDKITAKSDLVAKEYKIKVKVTDSKQKVKEAEGTINVDFKKIKKVTITPEEGLQEGNENVSQGKKVASIAVEGGTPSYIHMLNGGADDSYFQIDMDEIKVKNDALTEKEYHIKVKTTDMKGKEAETEATITVSASA